MPGPLFWRGQLLVVEVIDIGCGRPVVARHPGSVRWQRMISPSGERSCPLHGRRPRGCCNPLRARCAALQTCVDPACNPAGCNTPLHCIALHRTTLASGQTMQPRRAHTQHGVMCGYLRCERERTRRGAPAHHRRGAARGPAPSGALSLFGLTSFLIPRHAQDTRKSARLLTRHGSGAHVTRSRAPSPYITVLLR